MLRKEHVRFYGGERSLSDYSWRGADVSNILDFEKDWPDTTTVKLEENYRSTPEILECANCVIKNNKKRKEKRLFTENSESGNKIEVREVENNIEEAQFAAETIKDLRDNDKYDYKDFVVLYRTNAQSRSFEEAMTRNGIPYKTVGSIAFYARAEIKDLLSYLSVIDNPKDDLSFLRIINTPRRGIGAASLEKLTEFATFKGWSLYETVENIDQVITMSKAVKGKFRNFYDLIETIKEKTEGLPLYEKIKTIYEDSGYEAYLKKAKGPDAESRIENIQELVNAARQFSMTTEIDTVSAFLENASLSSSVDELEDSNQVSLMTLHSAKGLEYPVVFLTGLEENLFPSFMSLKQDQLEEERRLCYVGITRAMDRLYMLHAARRMRYGTEEYQEPSRFIKELPEEYINTVTLNDQKRSNYKFDFDEAEIFDEPLKKAKSKVKLGIKNDFDIRTGRFASENNGFKIGDMVESKAFGIGRILELKKDEATIAFPGEGIKHLVYGALKKHEQ